MCGEKHNLFWKWIQTQKEIRQKVKKRKKKKQCLTNHWIHDALFFKPAEIHVHGIDFAPQVAVVLTIVASSQVAETGCHVCAYQKTSFFVFYRFYWLQARKQYILMYNLH